MWGFKSQGKGGYEEPEKELRVVLSGGWGVGGGSVHTGKWGNLNSRWQSRREADSGWHLIRDRSKVARGRVTPGPKLQL